MMMQSILHWFVSKTLSTMDGAARQRGRPPPSYADTVGQAACPTAMTLPARSRAAHAVASYVADVTNWKCTVPLLRRVAAAPGTGVPFTSKPLT